MARAASCVLASLCALFAGRAFAQVAIDPATVATLPPGVEADWSPGKAWHETTPTREKICLNGLWEWQPATAIGNLPPRTGWGWFKVPGPWPGIEDYMQKDCQTVIPNLSWKGGDMARINFAWYERPIWVPAGWADRRIAIQASYVNSMAFVFVDGKSVGQIAFPAGAVDLTGKIAPGGHTLDILVAALPMKDLLMSFNDTNSAKLAVGTVPRRGLCGDVFLTSSPKADFIGSASVETSFQQGSMAVHGDIHWVGLTGDTRLRAEIEDHGVLVKSVTVPVGRQVRRMVNQAEVVDLYRVELSWKPKKLWDIDTPDNQFDVRLSLLDSNGKVADQLAPIRFGFREFWIKGRDFYLNGTRLFLSEVPLENAGISAGLASYDGAKETLRRLKQIGINMVYMHNYDCNPGDYLSFDEILRAADDVGMLVALTMPHFGDYEWPDKGLYQKHAAFFAHVAGSHPSVIAYSTSHNATGYNEDTDPFRMDGLTADRDNWASSNVKKALQAETIIHQLDPSRIVYHHSGGNLGSIYTVNFYLNFVPPQELDDWFEHWATAGVKPMFLVEYGVPFSWDWTMYRGWYKGERHFGEAQAPWEYCMAEWNAQFLGDTAYRISDAEKRNLRWEAPMFAADKVWYRWDYPYPPGSVDPGFSNQQRVWAQYTTENWRAFRTWGVSGTSPWETSGTFWRVKPGVRRSREELKTDWSNLQQPGYSADYVDGRFDRRDTAFAASDWEPTTGGEALLRNNMPCLAYIAGKPGAVTSKDHIFHAGEKIEKQVVLINNSRRTVHCTVVCESDASAVSGGHLSLDLPTGEIQMMPIEISLPYSGAAAPEHRIVLRVDFGPQGVQTDELQFRVLPNTPSLAKIPQLAIYDPAGETTKLLAAHGVTGTRVDPGEDLSAFSTVIVGKNALTVDRPGPDLSGVKKGQKVIVFEQSADVLEKRLGFRVEEYGLRNVFRRVPDSPVLEGLTDDSLRDWRGSATLIPPRLNSQSGQQFYGAPSVMRTGMLQTRVWRCGTRGSVADVLIEKPAAGDFLPLIDGGFSLEYSPLLEYREGRGMVIFCQMDVTGRTEIDPAAERLVSNLLNYVAEWKPSPERSVVYVGEDAGREQLTASGIAVANFSGALKPSDALVLGPGSGTVTPSEVSRWLENGGHAVGIGLTGDEAQRELGYSLPTRSAEYINSTSVTPVPALEGVGPADVYNHAPRQVPMLDSDGFVGVIDSVGSGREVLYQLVPWSFDVKHQNTKRTFRRTSFVLSRILGNLGVHGQTPLLARFKTGTADANEKRWLSGFYLDTPEDVDDPYRFFGW